MLDRLTFIRSSLLLFPLFQLFGARTATAEDVENAKTLNKRGEDLIEKGQYPEAMALFKKMHSACGPREYCRAIAIFYLGRCHLEMADYELSLKFLEKAERMFAKLNRENEKAVVVQTKARLFAERSQYRKSLALYDGAATVFAKLKNKDALFELFNSSGAIHTYLGLSDQGMECMSVANTLLSPKPHPRQLALLNNNMGLAQVSKNDYRTAHDSFQKALEHFKKAGNVKGISTALNNIGYIHEGKAEYRESLAAHQESLDIARKTHDARGEAIGLNNIGNVHLRTGDYSEALKAYEESLAISEKRGIRQFVAETMNNLGLVRIAFGEYPKAMECFQKSYRISASVGVLPGQAWALHNLAFIFKDQGKFKDAVKSSEAAIRLAEKTGDRRLEATAVLRLGNLCEYRGHFEDALKNYERSERIQKTIGDLFFRANSLTDLANAITRNGEFDSAKKRYEEAVEIKQKIGAPVVESLCKFALFFMEKSQYAKKADPGENKGGVDGEERQKDLTAAREYIRQARKAIKSENVSDELLLNYVDSKHLLEQDPTKAVKSFEGLKSQANSSGAGKYSFLASVGIGLAHERLKNWPNSEKAFAEAVEYAEKIRHTLEGQERMAFLQGEEVLGLKHKVPYDGLARVREAQGKKQPHVHSAA
jgi:tetratricopeptide (TPR) repeat protein